MYNVKELRERLAEKVAGLGIDPKFKENPAYISVISEIDDLISQMNMSEKAEAITVQEEQGKISFNYVSTNGEKYSMTILCSSPDTFRCIRVEEKKPFIGNNGQTIRVKNVIEHVATIDKSGFITLITNGSSVDNIDCSAGKCNNSTWAEKKYYTSKGVMRDREYKGFAKGELTEDFDRTNVNSMLLIPRQNFRNDNYVNRTLLVRDKLDTARIVSEDKSKGIRYSAVTPLNQEHGLSDLVLPGGYDPYPQDVVISPLSQEEIEAMLKRENPIVAEGLREFAVDRETYHYSTADDPYFLREGFEQSENISR